MSELPALRRLSLRARLVSLATAAVTLVLVAGGLLLGVALRDELTDDLEQAAVLRARDIAVLAARGSVPEPVPIGDDDEALVQVVVGQEVVAASANAAGLAALDVPRPPAGETDTTRVPSLPLQDEEDEGDFLVAAASITVQGRLATVYVASSLEDVTDTLGRAGRLSLLALPGLVAILGTLIWVLVGRTLAPVEAIRAEAEAITGTGLHRRVPEPPREDEVGRLARTLNGMLARLQAAAERQRRFVADAAHELRTPVASVRTTLETARSSPRQLDWEEISGDVLTDTIRMQALTEQLLLLARVDADQLRARMRPVDLDEVIADVVERLDEPRVTVDRSDVEPLQVTGDQLLLEQVVRNLLDNAAAHATGRVAVGLYRLGGAAVLVVDDDGAGIPPERRQEVFERFSRLDQDRARARGSGAGLGLAIVADIVAAHGGQVRVGDSPLGGARLEVRLPIWN